MDVTDSKNSALPSSIHADSHTHKHEYPPIGEITVVPTLTSIPTNTHTDLNPKASTSTHDVENAQPKSPQDITGFRARIRAYPRPFAILAGLIFLLVVSLVGLVLYMVLVPNAFDGGMAIVNALFVVFVVAVFALMFRQALILHQLFHLPSYPSEGSGSSGRSTWLTGLPSYREAVGTSTIPERLRGELPVYGDTRGTELLAKTSRGNSGQTQLERARNRESITEVFV